MAVEAVVLGAAVDNDDPAAVGPEMTEGAAPFSNAFDDVAVIAPTAIPGISFVIAGLLLLLLMMLLLVKATCDPVPLLTTG